MLTDSPLPGHMAPGQVGRCSSLPLLVGLAFLLGSAAIFGAPQA